MKLHSASLCIHIGQRKGYKTHTSTYLFKTQTTTIGILIFCFLRIVYSRCHILEHGHCIYSYVPIPYTIY